MDQDENREWNKYMSVQMGEWKTVRRGKEIR